MADPTPAPSAPMPTAPSPAPAPISPAAPMAAPPPLAQAPSLPPEAPDAPVEMHWPRMTESIAKLIKALAIAQGKIGSASKDSQNPHFKSKYASLASVREACREALSEVGIAVIQHVTSGGGRLVTIHTMLALEEEYMVSHLTLRSSQDTPQGIAAAVTYGRRVGLSAMVGVAPEDDDGNEASSILPKGVKAQTTPPRPTEVNQPMGMGGAAMGVVPVLASPLPTLEPPANVEPIVAMGNGGGVAPPPSAGPLAARAPQAAPAPPGVPPPPGRPPMKAPGSK